jgi:formylglycine-generating enzyme required for sulfatase activity/mono/diheme cytochrome c family protein
MAAIRPGLTGEARRAYRRFLSMKGPILGVAGVLALLAGGPAAAAVDFKSTVKPILEANCLKCHGSEKPKGKLDLTTRAGAIKGGENGASIVPGDPDKSTLYTSTTVPGDDDKAMPPKGPRLSKADQTTLHDWIKEGAAWPDDVVLAQKEKVDFVKQIKPIFETRCVSCHKEGHAKGELRMDDKTAFFKSKDIKVGDSAGSKVYTSLALKDDDDDLMPPKKKGGPLPKYQIELIRNWVDQGAEWPDGLALKEREADASTTRDEAAVYAAIHALLVKNNPPSTDKLEKYREPIANGVGFDMVPIPGGEFEMGSPEGEPNRKADEGPRHKVKIDPFWMGKTEVTWDEYELFMFPSFEKGTNVSTERVNRELLVIVDFPKPADGGNPYAGHEADAVSRPTTPYVEMSFGMGKEGFPAISMTHFAALYYCRWLTAKTGHFYRLATEAEWEYACRAGTTTRYFWGDDPAKADEYAWFFDNADGKYQKVGTKKPNPWGLYDMIGNVAEWTMDGYKADAYSTLPADNPWLPGFAEYPHVARGGSWDDGVEMLRAAARRPSNSNWKMRDPQLPKSKWYLTDAQFLGWRVVRSPKIPATPEELRKVYTSFPFKD